MKLWFLSDTHNHHNELRIPSGIDAVIHCGYQSESGNEWLNETEGRAFFEWYSEFEVPQKIFVPGNYSTEIERGLERRGQYPKVRFFIHD